MRDTFINFGQWDMVIYYTSCLQTLLYGETINYA